MISVVLPCYKDACHLRENVRKIAQILELLGRKFEIILVNDASPDETGTVADEIAAESGEGRVRVFHHPRNRGRGAAFITGARQATGDIVGYLDVDLEVSPVYLVECIHLITHEDADLVVGQRHYRVHLGLFYRHVLSRCYSYLVSRALGIPSHLDSESGFKFFRRQALEPYLHTFIHHGWFWDTEVVSRFHRDGRRIASFPCLFLRNSEKKSTVRLFRDTVRYAYELWRYRRLLKSDGAPIFPKPVSADC